MNYLRRTNAEITDAITSFCRYHDLVHEYIERGAIHSSVDRGAFVRPKDVLDDDYALDMLGRDRRSNSYAYGPEAGDHILREKIAELENQRHGTGYTEENIAIMPGAWAALEFALQEIFHLKAGRREKGHIGIIGPTLYQMFHYPIATLGFDCIAYDFVLPEQKHIPCSLDDMEEVFSEKPKAIVLTNPNNPDGVFIPTNLLEQIVKRAENEKIYVIIDEMQDCFKKNDLSPDFTGSDDNIDDYGDTWIHSPYVVRVNSPSKRYALAECRVGWVIADETLLGNRMHGIIGRMSGFMGNAPRIANTLLTYLLKNETEVRRGIYDEMSAVDLGWLKEREEYVLQRLKQIPAVKKIFPRDACINIAFQADYPRTDLQLAEELMKNGTLLMPASGYGYRPKDVVMRFTFAERVEKLDHALTTLEKVLKR